MIGDPDPAARGPPRRGLPVQELAGRLVACGHQRYLWAAASVTPSRPARTSSGRRRRHRRPAGRGRARRARLGRSRVAPGPAVRHRRMREGRHSHRDHHVPAEVYRPESRKPEVAFADDIETDPSRRDFTINAMALRPPIPSWSTRSTGGGSGAKRLRTPLSPRCRSSTTPVHDAGGPFHRRSRRARRRGRGGGRGAARPHGDRQRERIRARARSPGAPDPSAGLWFLCRTGLSDEFLPSSTPCSSSRTRSISTRTCSPTRSQWCANALSCECVPPRSCTTSASRRRARSVRAVSASTTTRS